MWLLDSEKPNFYNLLNYFKIELDRNKKDIMSLRLHRFNNNNEIIIKTLELKEKTQYNSFKEKLNNFLRSNKFLFIESNLTHFIWINSGHILSIVSNIINTDISIKIETTNGYIDTIEIGTKLELQLFIMKNLDNIITIPNKPLDRDTRGRKAKFDLVNISF